MKRIIICSDGTWNSPEKELVSNVTKTARAVLPTDKQGVVQTVFYDWGLGSYHDEKLAGLTGKGIDKNIRDGYRFLVHNYETGDEIFLFGYSRGAYTELWHSEKCACRQNSRSVSPVSKSPGKTVAGEIEKVSPELLLSAQNYLYGSLGHRRSTWHTAQYS